MLPRPSKTFVLLQLSAGRVAWETKGVHRVDYSLVTGRGKKCVGLERVIKGHFLVAVTSEGRDAVS